MSAQAIKPERKVLGGYVFCLDLYTVQRAGDWKTNLMVQRYAHLSPDHILAAVEKLALRSSRTATGTNTGSARA